MMRSAIVLALFVGVLSCQGTLLDGAHAGEAHSRLSIEASVSDFCDIGGGPSLKVARGLLDFGSHRLVDTATGLNDLDLSQPVKGTMPLLCSEGSVFPEVSFSNGLHATGKQRNLQGPGGTLIPYELLRGSSPSQGLWDDNAYPVHLIGGKLGDIPLYGYIPALPAGAKDGFYTDTVTVRVDF
ncbi:spore coat protein U domain-containing protein [Rhodanobacter sp. C03]|uniref:Csu type fimbrial protein n=1 Tax=Rhodanobacter sp. C03 TaxID=1945858 RepID=UPI0009864B0F|nr:spore coat protein U domain-containing protein [Rhodanobacter sp. C03]OOG53719.1 hypothetical protein B0E48_15710 [Rhodanobacter sp. C03]